MARDSQKTSSIVAIAHCLYPNFASETKKEIATMRKVKRKFHAAGCLAFLLGMVSFQYMGSTSIEKEIPADLLLDSPPSVSQRRADAEVSLEVPRLVIPPIVDAPPAENMKATIVPVEYVAVIEVQPFVITQSVDGGYGSKTASEILEASGCSSLHTKIHSLCGVRCGGAVNASGVETRRGGWCKKHCVMSCREKICNFGDPPPMHPISDFHVYRPPSKARLIPRIVHQTWREPITQKKYPNWSHFQKSFQQDGYEYRFYTDGEARAFLKAHFPPEILSVYDDILPGAFKADLFRYCILLLYGGVYADIDILMASLLDDVIQDDTGFVVPLDKQPFMSENVTLCLWNGFMAVSPGHPFVAKVIENVVNAVRNRFNYLDYAQMVTCPFQASEDQMNKWALLFATGPCMLGLSVNQVLGRHEQTTFTLEDIPGNSKIPGKSVFLDTLRNKVS
jgi:hypothetical protein